MKLALVITIKNERRLLRKNLEYHHLLGVDHVYIYLDGTEDGTEETIKDLDYVSVAPSVGLEVYRQREELVEFTANHAEHHTARQMVNMFHAKELALKAGYEWLIAIDADELVCIDLSKAYPGQLKDFFTNIDQEYEIVRFKTLEILQHQMKYQNVFTEETFFKVPEFQHRHIINDPIRDSILENNYFYGQTKGKCAVRTIISAKPKSTHKFVTYDGSDLETIWKGYLLHYYAYDFKDFLKKFKNFKHHPNNYVIGSKVEDIKCLWRDLVNDPKMSIDSLRSYYQTWVLFKDHEIKKLKKKKMIGLIHKKPGVIEVNSVRNLLNKKPH